MKVLNLTTKQDLKLGWLTKPSSKETSYRIEELLTFNVLTVCLELTGSVEELARIAQTEAREQNITHALIDGPSFIISELEAKLRDFMITPCHLLTDEEGNKILIKN